MAINGEKNDEDSGQVTGRDDYNVLFKSWL